MTDASQIANAINLRVHQLEAQGITGMALANHMMGHMQDLYGIYNTATDQALRDLCDRFPGFERYASMMEEISEQNEAMMVAGRHPYGDLPELPEPLKAKLIHVMSAAAKLEREVRAALDCGQGGGTERLTIMKQRWADDLGHLVFEFQSSDLPARTQILVQQVLKATAERVQRMVQE